MLTLQREVLDAVLPGFLERLAGPVGQTVPPALAG